MSSTGDVGVPAVHNAGGLFSKRTLEKLSNILRKNIFEDNYRKVWTDLQNFESHETSVVSRREEEMLLVSIDKIYYLVSCD